MAVLMSLVKTLRDCARSRAVLQLEVLALRHQLRVLQRSHPHRLQLTRVDRLLWVWLSRAWNQWRTALVIVKPETVIAWYLATVAGRRSRASAVRHECAARPKRVRLSNGANQRADIRRLGRSPHSVAALPRPPHSEAPSVPGDDGLRLDDDERRSPSGPEAREHDPEPTVCLRKPQPPGPRSLQHLQLVPQGQYFELQRGARMRPRSQGQEEGQECRHHRPAAYPSSTATSTVATRTEISVGTTEVRSPAPPAVPVSRVKRLASEWRSGRAAILAGYLPARHASRIDPMIALRHD